mgnify:CR=1 FL=1
MKNYIAATNLCCECVTPAEQLYLTRQHSCAIASHGRVTSPQYACIENRIEPGDIFSINRRLPAQCLVCTTVLPDGMDYTVMIECDPLPFRHNPNCR